MNPINEVIENIGNFLVETFHKLGLFIMGATVVWSASYEYVDMMSKGYAELKDILLLFIYLELGAMIGIYFKTRHLPVQFLIFIAITALSRHLVIDVQYVADSFHLYLLLSISGSIILLSCALYILSRTANKCGRPEDEARESSKKESRHRTTNKIPSTKNTIEKKDLEKRYTQQVRETEVEYN